ncbi:helix-turn-helix domain-containing protein [Streptomyces sp. NPDC059398]|uniref:helix-turn-helix domain-containing protein n=1 Tax=Streptomyces sp. NPDC059398 TaxID=3346820 RepID=UPI00369654B9
MRARSGPTLEHRVVAEQLRLARERAGCSLAAVAVALDLSEATVRRIERAETALDAGQVRDLLEYYHHPEEDARRIRASLVRANEPGWWHRWRDVLPAWQRDVIGIESSAGVIRMWHPALVPDLLRTPAYAAAVEAVRHPQAPPAVRARRTEFLRARQERFHEREAVLWALVPEAALHTCVGSPEVMREQLDSLRQAVGRPNITLQVMPLGAGPHALTGAPPLELIRLPVPEIPDHAVVGAPGGEAAVTHDRALVSAYRMLLDSACGAAPAAGAALSALFRI